MHSFWPFTDKNQAAIMLDAYKLADYSRAL